jgi:hypothetical protein
MHLRSGFISAAIGATMLGGSAAVVGLAGASTPTPTATLLSANAASSVAAATATPATAACNATTDDGAWPVYVDGRPPGLDAGDAPADYVWHDATGWHVRITHQNDHHQVWSGVLTTAGTFSDVDAAKLEKNDFLRISPDKHTIAFRFNNFGGIDGLDFRTHCADGIHFNLRADGAPVNPTEVVIGHGDRNPPQVPFVVRRHS